MGLLKCKNRFDFAMDHPKWPEKKPKKHQVGIIYTCNLFALFQLIILMALGKGKSSIRCGPVTLHTETAIHVAKQLTDVSIGPRGYKTFSVLNSAEHEIYPAHKC